MRSICLWALIKPCLVPSCSAPFSLLPSTSHDCKLLAGKVSEKQMSEAYMKKKNYAHKW